MENITVGVIGTGTMGKGIVQVLTQSQATLNILWVGRSVQNLSSAHSELITGWDRAEAKGRIEPGSTARFKSKLSLVEHYTDLSAADIIIEAVSEDIEIKRSIYTILAPYLSEHTLVASNTSSLSITDLSRLLPFPDRIVGLHFFNPAPQMRLVEVVQGLTTSADTVALATRFAKALGKEPVLVNEAPGFIVNRMLIPMINEAIGILAEDVATADEIDKAMKLGANHPIGPLALADLIGNDVCLSIMETLHNETGDPKYRASPLLRKMVRANFLGRKSGRGFFTYR